MINKLSKWLSKKKLLKYLLLNIHFKLFINVLWNNANKWLESRSKKKYKINLNKIYKIEFDEILML